MYLPVKSLAHLFYELVRIYCYSCTSGTTTYHVATKGRAESIFDFFNGQNLVFLCLDVIGDTCVTSTQHSNDFHITVPRFLNPQYRIR